MGDYYDNLILACPFYEETDKLCCNGDTTTIMGKSFKLINLMTDLNLMLCASNQLQPAECCFRGRLFDLRCQPEAHVV